LSESRHDAGFQVQFIGGDEGDFGQNKALGVDSL
jgi:hypothetical protein